MSTLTQDPELMHHRRVLETATAAFITSVKSEDHDIQRYKTYVKDIKLILDDHVADCNLNDVVKQVLKHNNV